MSIDIVWKDGKISNLHILLNNLYYWPKNCKTLVQDPSFDAQEEGHNHRL